MFIFIMIFSALVICISFLKSGCMIRGMILSIFQGVSALFAVNFIGGFTGLHITVNIFSLAVSSLGGLPGVIFLVVTDFMTLL